MRTRSTKATSRALFALLVLTGLTAAAASFQTVSQPDPSFAPSASGAGASGLPILSATGRYVLFASAAGNLALVSTSVPALSPLCPRLQVFLRDRADDSTTLVSVGPTGAHAGNGDSLPLGISTNGQYALFESTASNLVAEDTNGVSDVFVRDLVNGTNLLVSVSTNGSSGNGASRGAVITPDGRYVAFVSAASDLVAGDTNRIPDVFLRDLQTSSTLLVSVGAISTDSAAAAPGGSSEAPVATPDGRYVAFYSTATNLVPGVGSAGEVYVRDRVAGTTAWASIDARSIFFANAGNSNEVSCNPRISDDGQFVAFVACTNRVTSTSARGIALRYDSWSGVTDTIHTNAHVPMLPFEEMRNLDLTPDGRFVALVANVTGSSGSDSAVYLWDAQSGESTLVSANTNGTATAGARCAAPAVSADGRFVTFLSSATDLTTNPLLGGYNLYRVDETAGTTLLVNTNLNGIGVGVRSTEVPGMSVDGSIVVFDSLDASLALNDRNHSSDVFAKNFTADSTELISARHPALPSLTPDGSSGVSLYSPGGSGRYAAFVSDADDLAANDTNGMRDVYVRDLLTGSNTLASVGTNGFAGAGTSTEPSISADGRYVAFSSSATNLTANDTGLTPDVFIRDLQTGTTRLVSVSTDGVTPGNNDSYLPTLSADGRYVLFRSKASNLAAGSFSSGTENLFLRDSDSDTTYALTFGGLVSAAMTPDGRFVAFVDSAGSLAGRIYVWDTQLAARSTNNCPASIAQVAISPSGNMLAAFGGSGLRVISRAANTNVLIAAGGLSLRPGLQFSGDGRFLTYSLAATNQVFLFDGESNTSLLVSKAFASSAGGNGISDSPAISADGRFVIFRSVATDIVADDSNDVPDLFVYDRMTGANSLLTQSRWGDGSADNRSRTPVFSGNGRAVLFQSWASDLSTSDFNQRGDLFAFEFLYVDILPASSSPGGYILSWPAAPGETYTVQYKDNLDDASWQNVADTNNIIGNRAYLTNSLSIPQQRFYRVIAE